jgi:small subunit ribosomal protein S21
MKRINEFGQRVNKHGIPVFDAPRKAPIPLPAPLEQPMPVQPSVERKKHRVKVRDEFSRFDGSRKNLTR